MIPSSTAHPVVCFGEILWDILPDKSLPGGAPMNVAYHLKKLGLHPALITKVGNDDYGKKLVEMLLANQLNTDYVQTDDQHPTGLVYARINKNHEVTYDIVFPSAWDFIEKDERAAALVKDAAYFVFGSLATRHHTSRNTLYALLEAAQTKVLDINLRAPHYSQPLVEELLYKADILKLNEAELNTLAAKQGAALAKEQQIQLLKDRFHIHTVIVTMGGDGAMVAANGNVYYSPGYKVQVADTIGSGDAFLAGFLYQLYNQASLQKAVDFAAALGALVAAYAGACPNYDPAQIMALMQAHEQSSI